MPKPELVVPVEDLRSGEKERTWPLSVAWLTAALADSDATPTGEGSLRVRLGLSGRKVVVHGQARAPVEMPCARSLDPVPIDVNADVFLLLSAASVPAPGQPDPDAKKQRKRRGPKAKKAQAEESPTLTEEDAALDTYDGERVVLDDFVREFIVLELPMVPLRSDLRSDSTTGIESPPAEAGSSSATARAVDPRLAPLAAIASRMRQTKE
jgi:uncharacterized protein